MEENLKRNLEFSLIIIEYIVECFILFKNQNLLYCLLSNMCFKLFVNTNRLAAQKLTLVK